MIMVMVQNEEGEEDWDSIMLGSTITAPLHLSIVYTDDWVRKYIYQIRTDQIGIYYVNTSSKLNRKQKTN